MRDLQQLSYSTLIELLMKETTKYTRMLKQGSKEDDFSRCKAMIERLTAEINKRKQLAGEHVVSANNFKPH